MAIALKDSPTGTAAVEDEQDPGHLDEGEEAASPLEEHLLGKVMTPIYQIMATPKYLRQTEAWMHRSKNLGGDIGHMAFMLLSSMYVGAKKSGVMIPPTVFFAQGGAAYLTIDHFLMLAEKFHIPDPNPDQVRETALGVVVESTKKMFGSKGQTPDQMDQDEQQQQQQPDQPDQPMLAANPISHAVGEGLAQQGLMGAQP